MRIIFIPTFLTLLCGEAWGQEVFEAWKGGGVPAAKEVWQPGDAVGTYPRNDPYGPIPDHKTHVREEEDDDVVPGPPPPAPAPWPN